MSSSEFQARSPASDSRSLPGGDELYLSLLHSLPLYVFRKDRQGRILFANQRLCDLIGKSLDELVGKLDHELFPADLATKYRGDDERVMVTGEVFEDVEKFYHAGSDEPHYMEVFKSPVRNSQGEVIGVQGMFWDITQRVRTEEALQRSNTRFQRLVEANIMGVIVVRMDSRIVEANQAFLAMLGYDRTAVTSGQLRWYRITPPELRIRDDLPIKTLRETGVTAPFEKEFLSRSGERIPVMVGATMLDDAEQCICFVLDMRRQKQVEEQLQKAKEAADAASQAKSVFLANMSHEIRTPLNAILGMTELVLDTALTDGQREYLQLVHESGESLLSIINDVLDFSKIEAGRIDLYPEPFELRESLGDAVRSLAVRAYRKGIELACRISANVPDHLIGDAGRLRQIIVNLVGNAIKFTEQGEVVVTSECVDESATECTLEFTVRDTGIGIPDEKLEVIFAPFEQADTSTTRRYGGTGLGLSISSRLVSLMGGEIQAESELGKGSLFRFSCRFPKGEAPSPAESRTPSDLNGRRILIVDDNPTNLRIMQEIFGQWGMEPVLADGGRSALVSLRAGISERRPIELVVTDMHMPEWDGLDLVSHIRRDPDLADLPVILLTSGGQPDDHSRRESLRISRWLMKPVKQSELLNSILDSIGNGLSLRSLSAEPGQASAKFSGRVLLAEDSVVNQKLARGLLEKWGLTLTITNHGQEAIAAWKSGEYDLILMDLQMPVMGGLEATRLIREEEIEDQSHIPIIALTAHAMRADREACLAAGMDGYLPKPIRANELRQLLEQYLPHRSEGIPVSSPESHPASELVRWDALLDATGGDRRLMRDLIEASVAEIPEHLESLRSGVADRVREQARRAAHTLQSSMRMFGAANGADLAGRIEVSAKLESWEEIPEPLQILSIEVAKVLGDLRYYLDRPVE